MIWPEIFIAARGETLTVILEGCLRNKLQHFAAGANNRLPCRSFQHLCAWCTCMTLAAHISWQVSVAFYITPCCRHLSSGIDPDVQSSCTICTIGRLCARYQAQAVTRSAHARLKLHSDRKHTARAAANAAGHCTSVAPHDAQPDPSPRMSSLLELLSMAGLQLPALFTFLLMTSPDVSACHVPPTRLVLVELVAQPMMMTAHPLACSL